MSENVDDANSHVGFWAPQPDFRIPERLSPGFAGFPDLDLEAIYQDQLAPSSITRRAWPCGPSRRTGTPISS